MVTKEKFKELIAFIQKQRALEDNFYEALKAISGDTSGVFLYSTYEDRLVELLHIDLELPEDDDILEWWMYDTQFGKDDATIIVAGKEINLDTIDKLYDYITTRK